MDKIFKNLWMIHKEEPFTKEELAFLFWLVMESANRVWHPVKRLLPVVACECGLSPSSVKTIRESLRKRNLICFEAGVNKNMPGTYAVDENGVSKTLESMGLKSSEVPKPKPTKRIAAKPKSKLNAAPSGKADTAPGDRATVMGDTLAVKSESSTLDILEKLSKGFPEDSRLQGNLQTGTLDFNEC